MDYPLNTADPMLMHIDMNSCFATIEQQANRLLRGRPVGIAANISPGGCIISPSYEAKRAGVKTGYRVRDALELCPDMVILQSDPDKYFYAHQQFSRIFRDYSPHVTPLSIDEAVIRFDGTLNLHNKSLIEIGHEIKRRVREDLGEWVSCNVGIGTNRFLAKLAASLHKPDGLDVITYENLLDVYRSVELMDLCGINTRNKLRLNLNQIYTPEQFLDAPVWVLWKQVFKSVQGYRWYLRLRGHEVDELSFPRRSYGQSYALHKFTNDTAELNRLMMKLCEKMGRRLRRAEKYAMGVGVMCGYRDMPWWHTSKKFPANLYSTQDLHEKAMYLLNGRPKTGKITHIAVHCYDLHAVSGMPLTLFDTQQTRGYKISNALDKINDKQGEYSVHFATMMGMENEIIKRVPFHATTDTLSEIYQPDEVTQLA